MSSEGSVVSTITVPEVGLFDYEFMEKKYTEGTIQAYPTHLVLKLNLGLPEQHTKTIAFGVKVPL